MYNGKEFGLKTIYSNESKNNKCRVKNFCTKSCKKQCKTSKDGKKVSFYLFLHEC